MSSRYSSCFSLTSPNSRWRRTCEKLLVAFSGVRNSCDMLARNSDLCRLAVSSSVETAQVVVHPVEVCRERSQCVAVRHAHVLGELAVRDRVHPRIDPLNRADQPPREDEPEREREDDAGCADADAEVPALFSVGTKA